MNFKNYILHLPVILFGARTDHTGTRSWSFVGTLELAVWEKKKILGKFSRTDSNFRCFSDFFLRSVNLLFDKTDYCSLPFFKSSRISFYFFNIYFSTNSTQINSFVQFSRNKLMVRIVHPVQIVEWQVGPFLSLSFSLFLLLIKCELYCAKLPHNYQ